jgi:hypothetical protein
MVVSFSVVENFTEGNILQWNLQPLWNFVQKSDREAAPYYRPQPHL